VKSQKQPYPLIWIDYERSVAKKRTSFEAWTSVFCERYFSGSAEMSAEAVMDLKQDYLNDTTEAGRIEMYISTERDVVPETHAKQYKWLGGN
jgi:hypothetical protein